MYRTYILCKNVFMYNTIKFTLYMYGIYYRNKNSICNLLYILKSLQCRLIQYMYYSIFCNISGSIYLTISLAVERYITVCHPFFKLTHNWPARKEGISGFYQLDEQIKVETGGVLKESLCSLQERCPPVDPVLVVQIRAQVDQQASDGQVAA